MTFTPPDPSRWSDFCRFASAQVVSGDLDPTYLVLRRFYAAERLSREEALWRTLLYVTWYHLGSALAAWTEHPAPVAVATRARPTGTERRCFRGDRGAPLASAFVRAVLDRSSSLSAWVDSTVGAGGEGGWLALRREVLSLPYGGPWTAYKLADLLKHVHEVPIEAPDIGVGGNGETSGPVPGLVALTGLNWRRCASDVALQRSVLQRARAEGVPLNGLDQLETALCDFNSLLKGTYYVGHDIDVQMEHLPPVAGLWEARAVFPDAYRGELGGWAGVRAERKSVYRDSGVVLT